MLIPCTPAPLARLALAALASAALLVYWSRTGDDVPGDSPVRAREGLLDLALAQAQARERLKAGLEDDVLAGRLSLREAAGRMSDYLDGEPKLEGLPTARHCLALLPGSSQEERCAVWLLRGIQKRLPGPTSLAERVTRLERELAGAYGR